MNPSRFKPLLGPGERAGSDSSVIVQFYIVLETKAACWRTEMHNIHMVSI